MVWGVMESPIVHSTVSPARIVTLCCMNRMIESVRVPPPVAMTSPNRHSLCYRSRPVPDVSHHAYRSAWRHDPRWPDCHTKPDRVEAVGISREHELHQTCFHEINRQF